MHIDKQTKKRRPETKQMDQTGPKNTHQIYYYIYTSNDLYFNSNHPY